MDWSTRVKTISKSVLCSAYKYSGAMAVQEAINAARGQNGMAILLFHRVTDTIPPDGLTISIARFRAICQMLKNKFRVVSLEEFHDLILAERPFPRRTVAITFDDSYQMNLGAAEILAEFGLPACFFLPTGFIGTNRIFHWDERLPIRLPQMTWAETRRLVEMGFEVGAHTVEHPNLATLSWAEACREITDSKVILEQETGQEVRWFAYPYGGAGHFLPTQMKLVKEAGFRACFSARCSMLYPGHVGEIIPRESVPYFHSVANLELHLAGCLHWVYRLKRFLFRKLNKQPGLEVPPEEMQVRHSETSVETVAC